MTSLEGGIPPLSKSSSGQEAPLAPASRESIPDWMSEIPEHMRDVYEREMQTHRDALGPDVPQSGEGGYSQMLRYNSWNNAENQERFDVEHNGSAVSFYGIAHVPYTWIRHGEDLLKAIAGADAVLIEGNPMLTTTEEATRIATEVSNEYYNLMRRERPNQSSFLQSTQAAMYAQGMVGNLSGPYEMQGDFSRFYRTAARIALAGEKELLSADPDSGQTLSEMATEVTLRDGRDIDDKLKHMQLVLGAAAGVVGAGVGITAAIEAAPAKKKTPEEKISMNRRLFLKGIGAFGALGAASAIGSVKVGGIPPEVDGSYPADPLRYGEIDYRDLTIARAIDEFTERNPGKKILVLYGQAHIRGIANYLENPRLREIKNALYRPVDRDRTARMYSYSSEHIGEGAEEAWSQQELFEIP